MADQLLVIDDSLTVRKLVELSFRDTGWTIDFAATGGEGIAKALATAPDLILLDFVLPDMKAIEVCERLSAHAVGRSLTIILMSARRRVRELFAAYPMVVDFVGKPFSNAVIRERATRARAAGNLPAPSVAHDAPHAPAPPAGPAGPAPAFTFHEKETAADIIYQRMRARLAAIPHWMASLGESPSAMLLARKLLTEDVIEGLLEGLAPLYGEVLGRPTPPAEPHGPADATGASLAGHVDQAALPGLLQLFALGDRTGELRIAHGGQTAVCYWQSGEILLVSSLDPTNYARGGPALDAVPQDELERAELAQRTGAMPIYVTLHERGALGGMDLPAQLERQGRQVLDRALAARSARFVWRELESLPGHVAAHGRPILIGGDTGSTESPAQLTLERLRRPSSWREAQVHVPGPDAIHARAGGFSARLARLRITADEQRVLALVDGRNSLTAIAEKTGIAPAEVARILYRLAAVDLVVATASRASSRNGGASSRPVMILDPDRDGFHAPLRELLASRPEPLDLIDLAGEADLLAAIQRERPALVVLNGSTPDLGDVGEVARAIRATPHLANVSLAAVLESQVKVKMDDLAAAGFDAVLVKPVLYSDLSKLIARSSLAAGDATRELATENSGDDPRR
ncbi:MAG TPA: response regulator [Candidatus Acidoferrum sp.]|nr:response regulator [Candidatus Acidoferrum sp.]